MTEVPEGPPLSFRWRRAMHRVARAEGPERIAPEWWSNSAGDAPRSSGKAETTNAQAARLTRDYFRVEDADGRRYWLFREGLYGKEDVVPRWYVQGVSA